MPMSWSKLVILPKLIVINFYTTALRDNEPVVNTCTLYLSFVHMSMIIVVIKRDDACTCMKIAYQLHNGEA